MPEPVRYSRAKKKSVIFARHIQTELPNMYLIVVFQDNSDVHVDDKEVGDDYVGHHVRDGGPVAATISTDAANPSPLGELVMSVVAATHKTATMKKDH